MKVLVDRGANIDAKNVHGMTPLHSAADYGTVEVVKVRRRCDLILDIAVQWHRRYLMVARPRRLRTLLVALRMIVYVIVIVIVMRVLGLNSSPSCLPLTRAHDSWRFIMHFLSILSLSSMCQTDGAVHKAPSQLATLDGV